MWAINWQSLRALADVGQSRICSDAAASLRSGAFGIGVARQARFGAVRFGVVRRGVEHPSGVGGLGWQCDSTEFIRYDSMNRIVLSRAVRFAALLKIMP